MRVWSAALLGALAGVNLFAEARVNTGREPRNLVARDDTHGDPIDGEPIENARCIYSKNNHEGPGPAKNAKRFAMPKSGVHERRNNILSPRAGEKKPLENPKDDSDKAFEDFVVKIQEKGQDEANEDMQLGIVPSENQVENWHIDYNGAQIPIGATGIWKEFGDKPMDYVTWGLHGCTAAVVTGPGGLWLGHWWETTDGENGPSSHLKKYIRETTGKLVQGKRGKREFTAVAVDILDQITPQAEEGNRDTWLSMKDLAEKKGNPFSDPKSVSVWYMALAKNLQDDSRQYGDHMDLFKAKFGSIFPGSTYSENTYKGYSKDDYAKEKPPMEPPMPEILLGTITVQYTPYDHDGGDDGCTPMARVRVFYENNKKAVIDKEWPATKSQLGKRFVPRAECNSSKGTCKLDVTEIWTCEPAESNLYARLTITDPAGKQLYSTPGSTSSPGVPINDAHRLELQEEGMKKPLIVVGEHDGDYVQFYYDDVAWTTPGDAGTRYGTGAECKLSGDDWNKDGPGQCPTSAITRKFECKYPC